MIPFDNTVNQLHNMFGGNSMQNFNSVADYSEEDVVCPKCKTSLAELRETLAPGCPYCYKAFRDAVRGIVYRYHGKLEHFGKVPARQVTKAEKLKEIETLEELKKQAVASEDYGGADALKRKIEALRSEL